MEEDKVYAAASIENDQDQLQNTLGAAKDRCRQLSRNVTPMRMKSLD